MTKRGDQLDRIEGLLTELRTALASLEKRHREGGTRLDGLAGQVGTLAGTVQQVMAARGEHEAAVLTEAKAARSASEATFAAAQSLAAVAVEHTRAVREVAETVKGIPVPPAAEPAAGGEAAKAAKPAKK